MSTIIWFIFTFWIPCYVLISIVTLKVRPKSNCPIKNHSKIMSEMKNWGNYISWKQSNPQTPDRQPLWQTWYIGQKIPLKIQLNINYMLTFLLQFCNMWNKCVVWCQKLSFSEFLYKESHFKRLPAFVMGNFQHTTIVSHSEKLMKENAHLSNSM